MFFWDVTGVPYYVRFCLPPTWYFIYIEFTVVGRECFGEGTATGLKYKYQTIKDKIFPRVFNILGVRVCFVLFCFDLDEDKST